MQFGTWLRAVRTQERSQGVDHMRLACYPAELTSYVQDHLAPALQGLEELYAQLPSKASPDSEQREHWEDGRESYITQIRMALDHIGAALAAVGCTDKQLHEAVQPKKPVVLELRAANSPACTVCEKKTEIAGDESVTLSDGTFLCSESCVDSFENLETVALSVADVEQAIAEGTAK